MLPPDSPTRVDRVRPWDRRKPRTLRIATIDAALAQASASQRQRPTERRASEARLLYEQWKCYDESRGLRPSPAAAQPCEPTAGGRKVLRLRKSRLPKRQSYSIEERDPAARSRAMQEEQRLEEMRRELMLQFRQGVDCGQIREVGPWSPVSSTPQRRAAPDAGALLDAGMTPQSTKVYRMKRELMKQFQLGLASGAIKQVGPQSPGSYPCTPTASAESSTLIQRRGSGRRDLLQEFQQLAKQENMKQIRRASSADRARNHISGQVERCTSGRLQVSPHPIACFRRRCSEQEDKATKEFGRRRSSGTHTMTAIMLGGAVTSILFWAAVVWAAAHVLARCV